MHAYFLETFIFYIQPLSQVKDERQKASKDNSKGSKSDSGKPTALMAMVTLLTRMP
jgi:hypothetical protein